MLAVDRKLSRPNVRFNPEAFKAARKQFDRGAKGKLVAMMKEAATDSFVAGCLLGRRAGYQKPFTLRSPEGVDLDADRVAVVRSALHRLGIRELLRAGHEGMLYEYAVLDFDWQVEGGLQLPVDWEFYEQHHFGYYPDGRTLGIRRGAALEPLPDGAMVFRSRFGPVMLPVLADFILINFGAEAWASFLETWGEPLLVGKYPAGASKEFIDEVEQAVDAVAASSRGVAPEGTAFEVIGSNRSTGDHDKFTSRGERRISIALLGHANAVEQSQGTQIGENTAAQDVAHHVAQGDMFFLEPPVQALVDEIWARNWGGPGPLFELHKERPPKVREELDKVDLAYRMGARVHVSNLTRLGLMLDETVEWLQRDTTNHFLD